MIDSLILKTTSRLIAMIMFIASVLMTLRGHNNPGGGFIGALIAVSGFALFVIAQPHEGKNLTSKCVRLIPLGFLCLITSAILSWLTQQPLLTAMWHKIDLFNAHIKLGTPLIFDIGVYFVIIGSIVWIISVLEELKSC
ncbi:MAG: Na+/H+ antiporter subunit B [Gammaproteobacteria bacterium]